MRGRTTDILRYHKCWVSITVFCKYQIIFSISVDSFHCLFGLIFIISIRTICRGRLKDILRFQ